MGDLIFQYLNNDDCERISGGNDFECSDCWHKEECYSLANQRCNSEFAESCNYGGCDTEEEFWEQLFD